ncbi:MAG TPA: response regulator, partial [Armatimonadota bacterium]|nr:response regulator [Armatimonadota bacterium]
SLPTNQPRIARHSPPGKPMELIETSHRFRTTPADVNPSRVLFIEEEDATRETLTELLEWLGYRVEAVPDPAHALSQRSAPDVLLISLDLSEACGTELLRTLRARPGWSHLPAVGLGAHDEYETEAFDEFLLKPIYIRELDKALQALTGARAARR